MSGDVHVRICERLGVRFPRVTRLVAGFQHEEEAEALLAEVADRLVSELCGLTPAVSEVFAVTKLHKMLTVQADPQAAAKCIRGVDAM